MVIDMVKDAEAKADMGARPEKNPFGPTDKEVAQQLIERLRRTMRRLTLGRATGRSLEHGPAAGVRGKVCEGDLPFRPC